MIDEATLDPLMAQVETRGLELLGPDGVLTDLTSRIMNRAMEAEMADHLGYERGDRAGWGSGNNRNGAYPKEVLTDAGGIPIQVPRDRNGTFEPALVPKRQRRISGFNDLVIHPLNGHAVHEADVDRGRISILSPIARALLGKEKGDDVILRLPKGDRELEVVNVEYKAID